VFFQERPVLDPQLGPIGAAGLALTPRVSLAADLRHHPLGALVWVDTTITRRNPRGPETFRELMVVQDTGSAITGTVRGDIFFGWGEAASWQAARQRYDGAMWVLLPREPEVSG
jgi:membrane-bound lytic murein transglycosylase A